MKERAAGSAYGGRPEIRESFRAERYQADFQTSSSALFRLKGGNPLELSGSVAHHLNSGSRVQLSLCRSADPPDKLLRPHSHVHSQQSQPTGTVAPRAVMLRIAQSTASAPTANPPTNFAAPLSHVSAKNVTADRDCRTSVTVAHPLAGGAAHRLPLR